MSAYDRNGLRGGDVVTRIPIFFAGSIEALFNELLSP
jgi:hypothetical protein